MFHWIDSSDVAVRTSTGQSDKIYRLTLASIKVIAIESIQLNITQIKGIWHRIA